MNAAARDRFIDWRKRLLPNGPRYGVNDHAGAWPSGPVFAWFVSADDAIAYASAQGLTVWDLGKGRKVAN